MEHERPKDYWRSIPLADDIGDEMTPGMRSAARPLRLLEFFDEVRRPAKAQEISERLEIPQSTASVLLKALVNLGYLDYEPTSRSYQTSLRVTLLGSWRDEGRKYSAALMSMLDALAERTGLTPCLSVRNGIYLRYLQTIMNEQPGLPRIKLSGQRYVACSTAGIVMLAEWSDAEIKELLRWTKAQDEPRAEQIDLDRFWRMLARARADGWLCEEGLFTPAVRTVGCVVPAAAGSYGQPLALTLTNGTPNLAMPAEEVAGYMLHAVQALATHTRSPNWDFF